MQFIENSVFGLRSASYRLKSQNNPVEFLIFPMIHIGTERYYHAIQSALADCDEIIFEGVASARTALLTTSYRWVTRRRRLGLVTQGQALRLQDLSARLIWGDVSSGEFDADWRKIPWYFRLMVVTLTPPFGSVALCDRDQEIAGKAPYAG
ncbi:hypothetical protein [Dyella mobilis]|uniref:Uncharacterized protein n=1 Tax=Dyella mobilis TaxID=1849582 RepID=A0ABS2KI31_9GAMM|nr:hypothetical protein [Dyella mobilis]MBM7130786.1 hypothetical protein [Dyella mobilis]GLQ97414.1 hypothetical protein GCM10007863_18340 [Dyella mobilis]